ncbi:DUF1203 domain-containing protein [Ahniella affigens]|uniref:DUF1203 domain-containing protein n=1 Tax=Ahniella affigens TaxID=2021234 RepID=A0A2P1PYP2_9GAMM|nr:DUF1203 domain-containing protein [Ahniella affigens]AVP99950.1 DUF1203 domain-containing protein [Ahniella affigens]
MSFRISGLPQSEFQSLFQQSDADLLAQGIRRMTVDVFPGYPDRISLDDAPIGSTVLLLNYEHQPADTPYRSRHAIFVHEQATATFDAVDTVPPALKRRVLSIRAFSAAGDLLAADLGKGDEIGPKFSAMLDDPNVAYLHAHYAKPGCFAARVARVAAAG